MVVRHFCKEGGERRLPWLEKLRAMAKGSPRASLAEPGPDGEEVLTYLKPITLLRA
jgi:hypothetical protein